VSKSRVTCVILLAIAAGCSLRSAGDHSAVSTNVPNSTSPSHARTELVEAVVYTTLRPPNWDIYLVKEPGGKPRKLTDTPALEYNAVFSPDGRWVVFTSERSGNAELYALELERTSSPVRLTNHPAMDDAASFSPDGDTLTFVSTRDGYADIFVMPFSPHDTTAESRAVNLTKRPGGDFNPAFSPDGRYIAYSRQACLTAEAGLCWDIELCVMNANGSGVRVLATGEAGIPKGTRFVGGVAGSPTWSLDGRAIYYYAGYGYYRKTEEGEDEEIEVGPEIRRVSFDGDVDEHIIENGYSPAMAPENRLAFVRPLKGDGPPAFYSGSVSSAEFDGTDVRAESPEPDSWLESCFAPDFDRTTGRMVCHGPGTLLGGPKLTQGRSFAQPGAVSQVDLPDRRIAVHGIGGYFPALTPDGMVLSTLRVRSAVEAQAGRNEGLTVPLHISTIDGSGLREVFAPSEGIAWGTSMASDAGWIVLAVGPTFDASDANVDVWKVRLDGSGAVNLTPDSPANDAFPTISADGRRIVFRSGRDGTRAEAANPNFPIEMAIYVMDGGGNKPRRLTNSNARETMPAISPDGEWIVYVEHEGYSAKLWISRVDGSGRRQLESERSDIVDRSFHPRFSPDGKWVVFTSDRGGFNEEWPLTPQPQPYGDLWAVRVAGGPAVRLTSDKWEDGPNDWGYIRLPRGSSSR